MRTLERPLEEGYTISRQEKVLAAKAAFGQNIPAAQKRGGRGAGMPQEATAAPWYRDSREAGNAALPEEGWQEGRHGFGLLRFMAAAMLLLVLVTAFHQGFSYEGFDQAYVQEKLNDETSWNRLEEQVQKIYLSLEKKTEKE